MTTTRLPYRPPTLESLGSLVELTQANSLAGNGGDSPGYGPAVPPPGS